MKALNRKVELSFNRDFKNGLVSITKTVELLNKNVIFSPLFKG